MQPNSEGTRALQEGSGRTVQFTTKTGGRLADPIHSPAGGGEAPGCEKNEKQQFYELTEAKGRRWVEERVAGGSGRSPDSSK